MYHEARVICQLAGTCLLEVVQPGVFGLSSFTEALGKGPAMTSTVSLYFDVQGPAVHTIPSYVEETNYQNPSDPAGGPFSKWAKQPIWEWLKDYPAAEKVIGTVMQTYAANRPTLSQVYPTEQIVSNATNDNIVLVDIGGSIGHDILSFAQIHDFKPGTLVLQDRPAVIENAGDLVPAIKKMEYDFFTPQPVQEAAVYYL